MSTGRPERRRVAAAARSLPSVRRVAEPTTRFLAEILGPAWRGGGTARRRPLGARGSRPQSQVGEARAGGDRIPDTGCRSGFPATVDLRGPSRTLDGIRETRRVVRHPAARREQRRRTTRGCGRCWALRYIDLKRFREARSTIQEFVRLFPEDDFMRGLLRQVQGLPVP